MKLTPKPPLSALKALVALSSNPSMNAAALELGVTVSAVSHQIAGLEKLLNAPLLHRAQRPVTLTPLGDRYAARLAPAFASIDRATSEIFSTRSPSQISITTYPLFTVRWLVPRLESFYIQHPSIELSLSSTNRVLDIQKGEVDLAIRVGKASWPRCEVVKLMSNEVIVVCAPKLLKKSWSGQTTLSKLRLIGGDINEQNWHHWMKLHRFDAAQVVFGPTFDDHLATLEAAVSGAGLTLMLRELILDDLAAGHLAEIPFGPSKLTIDHYLVINKESALRPAVRTFVEWLLSLNSKT
jgi:LysR family transcriptional regulator, glycine cleavage system transcriptional activator